LTDSFICVTIATPALKGVIFWK